MHKHKVFIYGSLKQGRRLHRAIEHCRFLGERTTKPEFRLFSLGHFPGLVYGKPGTVIHGELYEMTDRDLAYLDQIEGVKKGLYRRDEIVLADGTKAYTYIWRLGVGGARLVIGGVW